MPEFLASIETYNPKIIFVAETWWHESSITNIENYMLFRKDRVSSRGGGVAIYVDTSLKPNEVSEIVLLDSPEQIWCEISYGSEHILLGCIYRPHTLVPLENIEASIIKANELLSKIYSGLLICGDFNLPGINWDLSSIPTVSNTDILSSNFIDILAESFLIQFVTKPTFQLDEITSNNTLDLIIAENENRVLDIIHHAPLTSLKKSHHVLQWDYVVKSAAVVGKHIEKRVYHKSNFVKISEYFNNINWQMEFNGHNTDDCYNIFLNHYEAACKNYVPVTNLKWIRRRSEWMNDDIKNKIKAKNKLWFRCRANGYKNLKLVNEYKACNIQLKKLIYKARCEFELDLAIKSKHNPKILFKYVNSKQNVRTTITALKGINDDTITNPIEIANRLNNHFQSVFNKNEDDELPYFIKRTEAICKYSQITLDLVKNKLSNLSVDKTVGLDGVSAYVLKNCSDSFSIPLSAIFQKSLDSGCCPKVWKKANVTPLFKNGSRLDPGNYRPISLTSVVCKVMEKILRDTMVNHLVEHSLISKNQHGFVNKKACVTNLLESIDMMSKALSDKISMDVAFIDFSKAFDMVPHKRLIYKLEAYGFTENLLNWIKSFLHQRFQRIVMGDYVSSWLEVFSGVPQGSVLGPILFIIFVNDISDIVNHPCKIYADDTKLTARLDHPLASQMLQTDIYNIADWCNTWKMKLNLDKCKIMHIGKKNNFYVYLMPANSNNSVELASTLVERDLGIMITPDLKWHNNSTFATNKANRVLGMLYRTFSHMTPQLLKILYTTFVRPHLEFAVAASNPSSRIDIDKIEKVQRRATRLVPSYRHMSYKDLNILNLTSLETRRIRGDLIQAYKIINNIDIVSWSEPHVLRVGQSNKIKTRGHHLKTTREYVKNCEQRHQFFTNRIVNHWNALPSEVVCASSVNSFKAKLDAEISNNPHKYREYNLKKKKKKKKKQ
ncbi:uncharacterized protein LOC101234374 [Hydra vulgaris]|uniref:uncharacterized protein LOC101234374 n=1 Tax=Hydra vulgaris TaxID=6087 RepID=UPI0032E9EFC7